MRFSSEFVKQITGVLGFDKILWTQQKNGYLKLKVFAFLSVCVLKMYQRMGNGAT